MKKILALLLTLTMTVGLLTACGKKADDKAANDNKTTPNAGTVTEGGSNDGAQAGGSDSLKTGLAVITTLKSSKSASADAEGTAQVDSFVAAVLVDANGKIVDCKIDAAQTKINFNAQGQITTPLDTVVKTKQELGTDYGMKDRSGIGKEWNEQADFFANYVIGKTADEVKGIAVNEQGYPTDADLTAGVTVHITDFIEGVAKAVANAKELGAKAGDKLGLGVYTEISKSKNASAGAEGQAQAYTYYAAATFDKDGKITSAILDASQGNVNFDANGNITSDLNAEVQTKQELKEAYGMKSKSGIGKEWYEQANAFADYAKGKTAADIKGIALSEGKPADADLAASVTVSVGGLQTVIEKAYSNATK